MDGLGSAIHYDQITEMVSTLITIVGLVGLVYHGWLAGQVAHSPLRESFASYYTFIKAQLLLWFLIAIFGLAAFLSENWDAIIYPFWLINITNLLFSTRRFHKSLDSRQAQIANASKKLKTVVGVRN